MFNLPGLEVHCFDAPGPWLLALSDEFERFEVLRTLQGSIGYGPFAFGGARFQVPCFKFHLNNSTPYTLNSSTYQPINCKDPRPNNA